MSSSWRRWAAGFGAVVACAAGGLSVGRLSGSVVAGLLAALVLGLGAMRGAAVLAWLRADASGDTPERSGIWGEAALQAHKALRRREIATQAERERLAHLLTAVEASPIGVLLLDAEQHISWCSRVAADHLGLDPRRDLGQPVTNLVRAPAFVEHMTAPQGEQAVVFQAPGGGRLSAMVQTYGAGLKLVLTQDITERERAETMRRSFVANVSHEIRTPLTVLAGFVETMSQLPLSETERKRVLTLMSQQAQRMQTLVADLLTLAQLEGSPRPPSDRWIPVPELMQRAHADALSLSAGRHTLSVAGGEGAQLAGSDNELHSALSNLVVNAVRYTPDGGHIEVRFNLLDDGRGELLVRDSGIGIEREHLPRLTERFYRVDGSRSRDTGGTGLGLSIVKHVVQRHGGEIDIQSEPGKGSSFRLLLPASRVRQGGPVRADAPAAESTG
jgi:two-component system, OmpR family, phosphate regulon sensor histidine kinase PhoR